MFHKQEHICVVTLLFICILTICLFPQISYADDSSLIALNGTGNIVSLSPDGQGGLYALTTTDLKHYVYNESRFESIPMPSDALLSITWNGSMILGLGSNGRAIYRLEGTEWVLMCNLIDDDGHSLPKFSFSSGNLPMQFIASSEYSLLTYNDTSDYQQKTILIDTTTGNYISVESKDFFPLCLYENQTVLALASVASNFGVYIYHPIDGQMVPFTVPGDLPLLCKAAAYHDSTHTLFWVDITGQLFAIPYGQMPISISNISQLRSIIPLSGESVAFMNDQGLYICDTTKSQSAPYIAVYGIGLRDNIAFTADTGIRVVEGQSTFSTMEHLSYALASHDSTIDVYGLLTSDGLNIIKEKGMYIDLHKSPILDALSKELYPKILHAIQGPNEELIGWPIEVQLVMRWEEGAKDILAKYGLTYPNTFEEMLDVAQTLQSIGALEDLNMRLFNSMKYTREDMLQYFLKMYIMQKQMSSEPISFDTPVFERIVKRIVSEIPGEKEDDYSYDEKEPLFMLEGISPIIDKNAQFPLRIDEDTPAAIQTLCVVGIINPYSKRIPEAIAYLEHAAQLQDAYAYTLYASMTEPLPNKQYETALSEKQAALIKAQNALKDSTEPAKLRAQIEALEIQIAQLSNIQWEVSPEAIAQYQDAARYLYISEGISVVFDTGIQQYAKRLVDGQISVQEFIDLCNKRVKMIYAE